MTFCNTDTESGMAGFKHRLRLIRSVREMTQLDLAKKAGFHATHISHFETGERHPSADNLRALCLALNVSADYLLDTDNDLTSEIESTKAKLAAAEQRIEQAEKIEEELTNTLSAEAKHIEKQEARIAQLEESNHRLAMDDSKQHGRVIQLEAQLKELEIEKARLASDCVRLDQDARAMHAELSRLEEEGK